MLLKLIRCGVEAASCLGEGDGSREEWLVHVLYGVCVYCRWVREKVKITRDI